MQHIRIELILQRWQRRLLAGIRMLLWKTRMYASTSMGQKFCETNKISKSLNLYLNCLLPKVVA